MNGSNPETDLFRKQQIFTHINEEHNNHDRNSPTSVEENIQQDDIVSTNHLDKIGNMLRSSKDSIPISLANALFQLVDQCKQQKQRIEVELQRNNQLQNRINTLNRDKTRIIANVKTKKAAFTQSEQTKVALQAQIAEMNDVLHTLRQELEQVSTDRDDLKVKLQTKHELVKELRDEKIELERNREKLQHERAMERELLENYRKLANYTGYYKWGKQIKYLEKEIELEKG